MDAACPFCPPCDRVENKSRQKKAAEGKQEDPYGGSTDENTDAEAEEDHPIPELPGPPPPLSSSLLSGDVLPYLSDPDRK